MRVLILWYTIRSNFGDVLLYQTEKAYLEKSGIEVDYLDVGKPCHEVFEKANEYDFLLFAGGGIIEKYVPNVIRYFKDDFHELNVPYGVIGLSVGDFDYTEHDSNIRFWVTNASFFFTRDEFSANKLNLICGEDIAKVGVDIVWANDMFSRLKSDDRNFKGLNIRNMPYPDLTGNLDLTYLADFVKQNGFTVYIPDESGEIIYLEDTCAYDVKNVVKQISKCKYIVAMRYHVNLVAAAMGIPTIPIAYCNKVHELSCQLGLYRYEIKPHELERLSEKINALEANYSKVSKDCLVYSEKYRKIALEILDFAVRKIKEDK